MQIRVHKDGTDFGAFPLDELNRLVASGMVPFYEALVWHEELADWIPLGDLPGVVPPPKDLALRLELPTGPPPLSASSPTPPPLDRLGPPPMPTKQGADALAWVIAFIPLAAVLLELALARPGGLWLVVFAANVGLCYRDEVELRKAGYETKGMGATSFFIPVYLWKRSELLRQGKGYFVAWIVSFMLSLSV
ncbi:DUF4339 domain-containing protein [Luteolibacter sp. LG18]|uniref:DUF4339 domain-containing protein n=1 Tax=Luteolibacter sp. LG18 TaxID=2819286 RepID=UPI002B2C5F8E|nr:hypothetical protein llg_11190 [Luteolibacter sp. LG18]